jgi:hypothetical protein
VVGIRDNEILVGLYPIFDEIITYDDAEKNEAQKI